MKSESEPKGSTFPPLGSLDTQPPVIKTQGQFIEKLETDNTKQAHDDLWLKQTISEHSQLISEQNQRTLEIAQSILENGQGISEIDQCTLEIDKGILENTKGMLENDQGISEIDRGIPENDRGISEIDQGISENGQGIPEIARGISEITRGLSESDQGLSETARLIKKYSWRIAVMNIGPFLSTLFTKAIKIAAVKTGLKRNATNYMTLFKDGLRRLGFNDSEIDILDRLGGYSSGKPYSSQYKKELSQNLSWLRAKEKKVMKKVIKIVSFSLATDDSDPDHDNDNDNAIVKR